MFTAPETFVATAKIIFIGLASKEITETAAFSNSLTIAEAESAFKKWAYSLKEEYGDDTLISISAPNVKAIWTY